MPNLVAHIRAFPTLPPRSRALLTTPLLLLALTAAAHADPLFSAGFLPFDVGAHPQSVAIADLNGDGRPDLATANNDFSGSVSVLLGSADGTFGPKADFGAGRYSYSVAIADLNADGRPDLAVANSDSSGTVSVLLGNGDGTFAAKTDFGAGIYPYSVAIADFNADGRPDLTVANHSFSGTVSVLLGNGDGTFGTRTEFNAGTFPISVAIADLNADGWPDLAIANNDSSGAVSVRLGTGSGLFIAMPDVSAGINTRSVAIADLNADGRPDLAVANAGTIIGFQSTVSVMLGNGNGTFGPRTNWNAGSGPSSVAIADLNADERPDLAVSNYRTNTVSVLLGNGNGTFAAKTDWGTGNSPTSVAIADLDADGRADLAVASNFSNAVSVLRGNGDGTFGTTNDFGTARAPSSVAIADLNADGWSDLAVATNAGFFGSSSSPAVSVLLGNGDGTFRAKSDFEAEITSHYSVAVADLNADGKPDVAVPNYEYDGTVSVLLGNGDGTLGTKADFGVGSFPVSVAIADLNADGRPDLAVANSQSFTITVLLGNGNGTFGTRTDFFAGFTPSSVAVADLNADGRPDLAAASYGSYPDYNGTVSVLLGNGDGTFGAKTDFGSGSILRSVAIADLNADGRPDLAVASGGSNTVSVLLGNGNGTFAAKTDFATGRNPISAAIADLNADGKPDLAVANGGSNTISVLLGNGHGAFGSRADFGIGNSPTSVAIADLSADGRMDLAVTNVGSNTVSVLLNRGPFPPIPVAFDFTPNTLNLTSNGLRVTGYLEPASPFAASDIDLSSIRLNGTVPVDPAAPTALGDHDGNGIPDLMVKFNRVAVELTLSDGDHIPVTVTGLMSGHAFSGIDYIRVRHAVVSAPAAGSHLAAGSVTPVRWETPSDITVESVALFYSIDGGSTWSLLAEGQPNTGSYDWTVPNIQTNQAKVAVVLVESADASGENVDGVVGVSETFSIETTVGVGNRGPARLALAIRGGTPSRAAGLWAEFSLLDGSPARLQLADVAGRVLSTKQVGTLGPGTHTLDLAAGGALRPGIYFLRLTQGGREVRARAAVIR